jgi:HlyD family secretion protein
MLKKLSKRTLGLMIGVAAVLVVSAVLGVRFWKARQAALPEGIVSANGRLEGKLVDVATKEPLRIKQILVDEGALVEPGQVVVRMDTATLEKQLAEAVANVAAAEEKVAVAKASVAKAQEEIGLAKIEAARSKRLITEGAGSQQNVDFNTTKLGTSRASVAESAASVKTAQAQLDAARESAATIKTRIEDATLKSPVKGRVLYRLAEVGEVLPPGGRALTLVNLEDIYMEIFLPSEQAASIKNGADSRIVLDFLPDRAIPGQVSFVSPEAQFTPKQVETRSEREKLMFRVKIQVPRIPEEWLERVKTGVRGVGYVRIDDSAAWPPRLQRLIRPQPQAM